MEGEILQVREVVHLNNSYKIFRAKFDVDGDDLEFRRKVGIAYAEGLCWVLHYYYQVFFLKNCKIIFLVLNDFLMMVSDEGKMLGVCAVHCEIFFTANIFGWKLNFDLIQTFEDLSYFISDDIEFVFV